MTYLFPILVASIISWILAKKGYWRIVNIVPACLSFLLGLYGSLNYGLYTTLVVFYPLSFILNGILIGNRAMVITILLSLVVHLLSALYISNIPWLVVLPSIASMTGAFVGIASLQWLSFALLNQALMHGIHDPLTGLYNRAFYDAEIERFSHTRRYPVSVLMCDLNGLKEVNATYGHDFGDDILIRVGHAMQTVFRQEDAACRIGGDEFAVFLPQMDEAAALHAADRLQQRIANDNLADPTHQLSIAIGCATCEHREDLHETLIKAERQMYHIKEQMKKQAQKTKQYLSGIATTGQ